MLPNENFLGGIVYLIFTGFCMSCGFAGFNDQYNIGACRINFFPTYSVHTFVSLLQTCRETHDIGSANLQHGPTEGLAGARPCGSITTSIVLQRVLSDYLTVCFLFHLCGCRSIVNFQKAQLRDFWPATGRQLKLAEVMLLTAYWSGSDPPDQAWTGPQPLIFSIWDMICPRLYSWTTGWVHRLLLSASTYAGLVCSIKE